MRRLALSLAPVLSCVLLAVRPEGGIAQASPEVVGVWFAGARNSPFVTRAGIQHRDFYAFALRAGWTLGSFPGVTLGYTADVLPIVATTNNVNDFEVYLCQPARGTCSCGPVVGDCFLIELQTGTVYGAGLSPIGLTAAFGPFASVSIQLQASAGAMWFTKAVPDPQALRFNFTASAGGALEIPVGAGYAALVGYMRHHTSNAGFGTVNPGLDSHMFYVGMSRRRERGGNKLRAN